MAQLIQKFHLFTQHLINDSISLGLGIWAPHRIISPIMNTNHHPTIAISTFSIVII